MSAAVTLDPLAQSGERPVLRAVHAAWRHGDRKLRVGHKPLAVVQTGDPLEVRLGVSPVPFEAPCAPVTKAWRDSAGTLILLREATGVVPEKTKLLATAGTQNCPDIPGVGGRVSTQCARDACKASHGAAFASRSAKAKARTVDTTTFADPEFAALAASLAPASPFRDGRSRAKDRATVHVVRAVSDVEFVAFSAAMAKRPVHRGVAREELLSESWLELANPTSLVAAREVDMPFADRLEKAVNRAQSKLLQCE